MNGLLPADEDLIPALASKQGAEAETHERLHAEPGHLGQAGIGVDHPPRGVRFEDPDWNRVLDGAQTPIVLVQLGGDAGALGQGVLELSGALAHPLLKLILRPEQLLLEPSDIGDVAADALIFEDAPPVVEDRAGFPGDPPDPLRSDVALHDMRSMRRRDQSLQGGEGIRKIVGKDDGEHLRSHQVLPPTAEGPASRIICEGESEIGIDAHDHVLAGFDQAAVSALAFPELCDRALQKAEPLKQLFPRVLASRTLQPPHEHVCVCHGRGCVQLFTDAQKFYVNTTLRYLEVTCRKC
jgi:hypothetical protein